MSRQTGARHRSPDDLAASKTRVKRVVVLYTSHERGRYSDTALDCLLQHLQTRRRDVVFTRYDLRESVREFLTEQNALDPDPELKGIARAIQDSDLLIMGSPVLNFTYSPYLHTLFHRLRHVFVTLDESENVVERNLKGVKAAVVLTGRSGLLKWYLVSRFVVIMQFKLAFWFWGGRVVAHKFLGNCRKNRFEASRERICKSMERFARRVARYL